MKIHQCEITRARDFLRDMSKTDLAIRMGYLKVTGEKAKAAIAAGWFGGGYQHDSNKGLALYTTTPERSLAMCRRDYFLTRMVLREREA